MRYNLYYITDKGSQLIDYSNYKSDLEKYISLFWDKQGVTFEIKEKKTLIDINLIRVPHSYKYPSAEKLANYRKICDNCKGKLLERNPIVIQERNNYLADGYCTLLILKEMGVEGNIPVSLNGSDNRIRLVYGKHKPNGKEYVWKIKNDKFKRIGTINKGDKLRVATRYGVRTITVTKTGLVPHSLESSKHRKVRGRANGCDTSG